MKDITIYDNFINDEELEEIRHFIGEESLDINGKINRSWHFNVVDNVYKKVIIDLTNELPLTEKTLIPSVQKIISKIINKIYIYINKKLELYHVYLNRQEYGQDGTLHRDFNNQSAYTFLIYIGDITPENYDKAGGDLELKTIKKNTRIEPFTKRAVLFKGYIPHLAYAPLVPGVTRISMAFKFKDMLNEVPFIVNYT